jgi:Mn-dependent DtxR family transcriptional regulator
MERKPIHPIDKEILRALESTRLKVTPYRISRVIGVHPKTAQIRIRAMCKKGLVQCTKKGNRTYCQRANSEELRKKLSRNYLLRGN